MILSNLYDRIIKYIEDKFFSVLESNPVIIPKYMAIEIMARLFVLSFGNIRDNSFAYSNINAFNDINHTNSDKCIDADLAFLRRSIKKYSVAHENKLVHTFGRYVKSDIMKMENNRVGRFFDMPNLLLISKLRRESSQSLLDLLFDNRICNSKKASDQCVADAYAEFDEDYSQAKKITDKKEYIFRWVYYHRMETEFPLSIIPQIADAILTAKFQEVKKWSYEDLLGLIGSYSCNNMCFYAYQILTNYNNIELLFSPISNWNKSDIIILNHNMRLIETLTVNHFNKERETIFKSFFNENPLAIEELYNFCRYSYPIIEVHESSRLYLSGKQLNKPKIKLIRKIIDALIDVEGISNQFEKVP